MSSSYGHVWYWTADPHAGFRKAFTWGLVGANGVVFLGWLAASELDRNGGPLRPLLFMEDNFLLTLRGLREGRWWTYVTSALSHRSFGHLAANMSALDAYVRLALKTGLSPVKLALLALGSVLSGSLATVYDWRRKGEQNSSALGASGLVCGLSAAVTLLRPQTMVSVPLLPKPVPMWMYTLAYLSYTLVGMELKDRSQVGHAAHLGGMAFGAVFYLLFSRRRDPAMDLLDRGMEVISNLW
ncbi:hypothetical protein BX600DRAFT_457603 [Xylariales sp. PMI_506]|nr:hypothetical protein BX600DRAFT_457603 [Xylariales sp. PMI_506]